MKRTVYVFLVGLTAALPARGAEPASSAAPAAATPAPAAVAAPAANAGGASGPTAAAKPGATPPLSPRFLQVRQRIDALFAQRNAEPPTYDPRNNPFRPAGAFVEPASTEPRGEGAAVAPLAGDVSLLQQAVSTLRIGGLLELGGRPQRIINSRPFKEGDVVPAQVQGETVYLRVKKIQPRSLTLTLNEAELTVPQ